MSFANLNLSQPIQKALAKCGHAQPTPIQAQAIPIALTGKDVIGIAQTGTGKTAAFTLPALERLLNVPKQSLPSILILAPVRELAKQITDAIHQYGSEMRVKVVSIFGGMPYHAQMRQLSQPVDIIVATPGRLIDYLNRGKINLSQIKTFVLDEADRMLDMGFIDDVKLISEHLPKQRQTLLFTATMDERIKKLANSLLHAPEHITIASKSTTLEKIKQTVYLTDDVSHKNRLLEHILNSENVYKAIIFSATKHHSDKLAKQLRDQGHAVSAIHGDIRQQKRNFILEQFRRGKINILVATDVAARGIDIADVSHVINFDIPRTGEDYVHRIGRTGRAGKDGIAISFILTSEHGQLKRIERYVGNAINQLMIEGLEPKRTFKTFENKTRKPKFGRRNNRNQNNKQSANAKQNGHKFNRDHSGKKDSTGTHGHDRHQHSKNKKKHSFKKKFSQQQ